MSHKIMQSYATKGNGVLDIDENKNLWIYFEDVEEPINLADLLSKYNDCEIKFLFAYDEKYEAPEIEFNIDEETGEVI